MDLCIFRFLSWSQTRPSPKLLLLILFLVLSLDTRKKWAPHPLWDMTVLPSPLHFLFIPELFKNSLFIHLGLLPLLLDFLHVRMDHSWGWKRWSLKFNHLSYITLLSVGLYPTKFFQSGLWNSETQNSVWILLFGSWTALFHHQLSKVCPQSSHLWLVLSFLYSYDIRWSTSLYQLFKHLCYKFIIKQSRKPLDCLCPAGLSLQ